MVTSNKSLGQYWLTDEQALEAIVEAAEIKHADTILEVGPGLGHLTRRLLGQASHVIAVELDTKLAKDLPARISNHSGKNAESTLSVVNGDILKFDLNQLPDSYKVVANIPYYLTGSILQSLVESPNSPRMMVLLLQKEVAERVCAKPGNMSVLAISVQLYYDAALGTLVPASMFEPQPKVDSQVVILRRHAKPLLHHLDSDKYFKMVKAGFSEKRKKLRSSLAGGLHLDKEQADELLSKAGIDSSRRPQELNLKQWQSITQAAESLGLVD